MKIIASIRKNIGTSSSRKLRNTNNVPAIIYGYNIQPKNIFINHNLLYFLFKKEYFYSLILKLIINTKVEHVLLRDYQIHAYKNIILHVDFQRINPLKKICIYVPLKFINYNVSPTLKLTSCVINYITNKILINCFPKYLPKFINVDLLKIKIGKPIYLFDLKLPNGVNLISKKNIIIVNVHSSNNKINNLEKDTTLEKNLNS